MQIRPRQPKIKPVFAAEEPDGALVIVDRTLVVARALVLECEQELIEWVVRTNPLQPPLQWLGLGNAPAAVVERHQVEQRGGVVLIQCQGMQVSAFGARRVATPECSNTRVVPECRISGAQRARAREVRLCAGGVAGAQQINRTIVIEHGEQVRVGNRLGLLPCDDLVPGHVHAEALASDADAGIDVVVAIDGVALLVPGQHVLDFLCVGLQSVRARQCHHHQGEAKAIRATGLIRLADGVVGAILVLQAQAAFL